jgi:hypothetical protein
VCIEESLIHFKEGRFIKVVYRDHSYTEIAFRKSARKSIYGSMCWVILKMTIKLIDPKEKDMTI